MQKTVILITFIGSLFLFSCKKNSLSSDPGNNNDPKVSSKDPVSLSKSLKIWHAVHVQGNVPVANAITPAVEGPENGKVYAFAGKYAVIQPTVVSGTVAGYYIAIEGAGEYFKLDYSKPLGERPGKKKKNILGRPMGDNDSTIVIILPTNIITPDSFCMTYYPFDSLGNIGASVTTCVYVNHLGADENSKWIEGKWLQISSGNYPIEYDKWFPDSDYFCKSDNNGSQIVYYCLDSLGCEKLPISDSVKIVEQSFQFFSNGDAKLVDSEIDKNLDKQVSTCSNFIVTEEQNDDIYTGGWSIEGNLLTLILEEKDFPEPFVMTFSIEKNNDGTVTLSNSNVDAMVIRRM